jgi:hypothetical protein
MAGIMNYLITNDVHLKNMETICENFIAFLKKNRMELENGEI